ncbi:TetR/AcrR family transcriptional regulator [Streptomyces sp. DT171]|uniref:TetR/AcrR family transcriptional regulator n=1 Tax=Streptomyces sp. DT171 TaxID=3416524 RepID=UPI003CF858FD
MPKRRAGRRNQVLSREQILTAAIELLDGGGEGALTVRALSERLSTGAGAIAYHVGKRDDLLDAATETVVTAALAETPAPARSTPAEEVRVAALALFDAITAHRWLATRLTLQIVRNPVGPVTVGIFERIGQQVQALGVPRERWFDAASILVHYILGAVSQNARVEGDSPGADGEVDRGEYFDAASARWRALAPGTYPFMHAIGGQMRDHDDREQFLTGITVILDGLARLH